MEVVGPRSRRDGNGTGSSLKRSHGGTGGLGRLDLVEGRTVTGMTLLKMYKG